MEQRYHSSRRFSMLVILFAMLFLGIQAFAVVPDVMKESFDYAEGDLLGQGSAGGGWAGPWEELEGGSVITLAGSMGYVGVPQTGGFLEVSESGTIYRPLEETWPDDGTVYWISFIYERFDTYEVDNTWNGVSLFLGTAELLYMGKPYAGTNVGIDATGVTGAVFSEVDSYEQNWLVVKLIMNGTADNDLVYFWVNPDPSVEPDTAAADGHGNWNGSGGFNRIRIGSGAAPTPCECMYDEICFSKTYAGLTSGGSTDVLPKPVNFFDFEEAEGTVCLDQGTAGNNGEMVGSWVDRVPGGIVTKKGDAAKCIEFPEENAFGELAYVLVPYRDYMNSPNYTLSAWVQYVGTPNWGYLFWANGDLYPSEVPERHIDVWFNPNNGTGGGVDCILHCVDGSQLRVATNADETGIGVMDGDWHQVTVVLKNNIEYTIYLDGMWAKDDEGAATAEVVQNSGDDLYIGARPNDLISTTSVKWVGLIDRVRIWDQALSEEQIEYLYNMEGPQGGTVDVADNVTAPMEFALQANYPNPFNPTTTISYILDKTQEISLEVYDVLGHKVATLFNGQQTAGDHAVQWNSLNENGQPMSSGVYLYRLTTSERVETRKMMLLK